MRLIAALLLSILGSNAAWAQFDREESHTTASLRGIDSLGAGVAWASGANGIVLRTEDGGYLWQVCSVPPGGAKLDFRGVQGFDANTAVVMASGKGALSKIYRTTDGCQTWKPVFENPNADGFFDTMRKVTERQIYLLGDPVAGKFAMFVSMDQGVTWFIADDPGLDAGKGDGAFAASNSSLTSIGSTLYFGMGGTGIAGVYATFANCAPGTAKDASCPLAWKKGEVPMAHGSAGAGIFSIAGRASVDMAGRLSSVLVAVGGDYEKPDVPAGAAAYSKDGGVHWQLPAALPGGYRSAVAFDRKTQAWLAVGPSGADESVDDGKSWRPLQGDTGDGWNAISLPFVVGSKGKIGKLRDGVLKP